MVARVPDCYDSMRPKEIDAGGDCDVDDADPMGPVALGRDAVLSVPNANDGSVAMLWHVPKPLVQRLPLIGVGSIVLATVSFEFFSILHVDFGTKPEQFVHLVLSPWPTPHEPFCKVFGLDQMNF